MSKSHIFNLDLCFNLEFCCVVNPVAVLYQ